MVVYVSNTHVLPEKDGARSVVRELGVTFAPNGTSATDRACPELARDV